MWWTRYSRTFETTIINNHDFALDSEANRLMMTGAGVFLYVTVTLTRVPGSIQWMTVTGGAFIFVHSVT